jgi:hypothetical protein
MAPRPVSPLIFRKKNEIFGFEVESCQWLKRVSLVLIVIEHYKRLIAIMSMVAQVEVSYSWYIMIDLSINSLTESCGNILGF